MNLHLKAQDKPLFACVNLYCPVVTFISGQKVDLVRCPACTEKVTMLRDSGVPIHESRPQSW